MQKDIGGKSNNPVENYKPIYEAIKTRLTSSTIMQYNIRWFTRSLSRFTKIEDYSRFN